MPVNPNYFGTSTMNYQDSSSDDIPYLPPDQYNSYEQQRNSRILQQQIPSSNPDQRRGRSHFSEDEIRELDSPESLEEIPMAITDAPRDSHMNTIPTPPSISTVLRNPVNDDATFHENSFEAPPQRRNGGQGPHATQPVQSTIPQPPPRFEISWGRRVLGILLIAIPAVLFSVAVHFIDWPLSDFQLFSASFFIFQGVFWPSFGILLTDLFCTAKTPKTKSNSTSVNDGGEERSKTQKWVTFGYTLAHSNLTAAAMILQLLSIQKLNISISLALSFGFDVVVHLIRYIKDKRTCSPELIILSIMSYAGYAVTAIPAFIDEDSNARNDTAIGVGASVCFMILAIPATLLLTKLRQQNVSESVLGTSFAFFGCIHSLITKEIMGHSLDLRLTAQSVGWAAGLISVVFLGTIFLFLETKLSSLIWQRDDDRPREFSSITRTRVAIFILSCLWELSRQGFRDTFPQLYDVLGGILVMLSFLLASAFQAWSKSCQNDLYTTDSVTASASTRTSAKFCAFIPWLFAQKSYHDEREK